MKVAIRKGCEGSSDWDWQIWLWDSDLTDWVQNFWLDLCSGFFWV